MALLFMDSFDHYANTNIQEKYTVRGPGGAIVAGAGRNGTSAFWAQTYYQDYVQKGLPTTSNTLTVGVAIKPIGLQCAFLNISEANWNHLVVRTESNGSLSVHRVGGGGGGWDYGSNTMLCQSLPGLVTTGIWHHVQVKVVIADAPLGTVDLRLNNVMVASNAATQTKTGPLGQANQIAIGGTYYFDDLWVCDGIGPAPWNGLLGDCRVDARYPTAAGAESQWTPSTGANWQNVDDPLPNSDTDFNSAPSAGLTDTFITENAPVSGSVIYGVQQCLSVRKTDAGAASIAPVIRIGGVDYAAANQQPSTLYTVMTQLAAVSPATGVQWTEAEFNAAEFGYRRTV